MTIAEKIGRISIHSRLVRTNWQIGRFPLETFDRGAMPIDLDETEGQPSRWNTLRALRVLDWYSPSKEAPPLK